MPADTKNAEPREYIVLRGGDDGEWLDVGRSPGQTAKQAIAALVPTLPDGQQNGTFVAIPARSWQPVTRSTETVVKATWT